MSLDQILTKPPLARKLKKTFGKPNIKLSGNILAVPKTNNHTLVGMAFNYLLRFYIEHRYPNAKSSKWIAEYGLEHMHLYSGKYIPDLDNPTMLKSFHNDDLTPEQQEISLYLEIAKKNFRKAKQNYESYLKSGVISKDLLRSTIHLAQLDIIYRRGNYVPFSDPDDGDISDLDKLITVFKENQGAILNNDETATADIWLNPNFGSIYTFPRGADADLIVGDTLIDIQTTKHLKFETRIHNKIIGYYLLYKNAKINNVITSKINNLGVYFSRFGLLHTIPISTIEEKVDIDEFLEWFILEARGISIRYDI